MNLYQDIKERLVAKGIPPEQIAFIHDATDDAKKAKLFSKVRSGQVRVIFGSTGKMGVGTNAQKRLIAMHHLDAPWKPAEVEQRDGRIVRQGNLNPKVNVLRYVTRRSFDAFMWQKLDTKSKFIGQVLSGARGSRTAEDVDSPLPEAAEMKAAASGDPRIMEHAELERVVRSLAAQRRSFESTRAAADWQLHNAKQSIAHNEAQLPNASADAAMVQDLSADKFKAEVEGQEITERREFGKAIIDRILSAPLGYSRKVFTLGKMSGFDVMADVQGQFRDGKTYPYALLSLKGKAGYGATSDVVITDQTDPISIARRYENILNGIRWNPERIERSLKDERANAEKLQKTLGEPWSKEKEFAAAKAKLNALTAELKAPQTKSPEGMPNLAATSGETGGASQTSPSEAPPGTQPLPASQVSTEPPAEPSTMRETPPSIFPAASTLRFSGSLGAIDPASKKYILQGSNDIKALRDAAVENQARFEQGLKTLAADNPLVHFVSSRVKDMTGLVDKVEAKGRPPNTISDYLGARMAVDTPDALRRFADKLHASGGVIEADNFLDPGKHGYRAYHLQVALGDGTSAELQLVPRPIAAVMDDAHALRQPIKRILDQTHASPEDMAKAKDVMAQQRVLFDDAWAKRPDWQNHGFAESKRPFGREALGIGPRLTFPPAGALIPQPGTPIARQAQAHVLARGKENGNEHLVAIDDKGKIVKQIGGHEKFVELPPDVVEHLVKPDTSIVVHHNHPKDSTLSDADISMLGMPGLHAVWAHGSEGTVSRAALTKFGRSLLGPNVAHNVNSLSTITNGVSYGYLFDPLKEALDRGLITKWRANKLLAYATNEVLRRAGLIDYHTNDRFEGEIASLNLDPVIDHATRELVRSIPNAYTQKPAHGEDGRRAGSVYRHPGDVGTAFERATEAPGRNDQQAVVNPKRGVRDRGQEAPAQLSLGFAEQKGPFGAAGAQLRPTPPRPLTGALATNRTIKQFKNFWASTFQPELFTDRALEADPLFARYKARQSQEKDAVIAQSEAEWNYWNKRSDAERIRFLDDVETASFGNVPPDKTQAGMARRYRRMLDQNREEEKRYGSQAAYVEDYMPHIWEKPEEWSAFSETRSAQVGPTWFQKKRSIDYITDGLAAGLKLKYTNPVDLIVHRLLSGVDMRQRMDLLYKLKEMGLAWEGTQGGDQLVKRGWRAINAPDRKQWVIAPDVQLLWKNGVEAKGLWQAEHLGGSTFRGWMAIKNAWVPIKLALSAFHPLHVMHIDQANSLALAWDKLAKNHDLPEAMKSFGEGIATIPTAGMIHYRRGAQARAAWAKRPGQQTPEEKAIVALMTDGGFVPQLSEQLKIAAKRQLAEAFQKIKRGEGNVTEWRRFMSALARRPIEKMQGAIFEKWIPALKAAAYLNQAAALMARHPEYLSDDTSRRIALRAIAKSIDNRYGEMNYGTMFWNRTLKDAGIASFLSLGWNAGFVREFGGAAMEAVTRPAGLLPPFKPSMGRKVAREATNKIAFVAAYVTTAAAIMGLINYMFTGEAPHGMDYIFPRIGGLNPDGSPRRVTNMTYLREVPMLMKHVAAHGGSIIGGTADMIWNKMMIAPFAELLHNKDYYGFNIYDENAPLYKQIWQAFKKEYGEQFSPMSISGAQHAAEISGHPFPSFSETLQHPERLGEAITSKGVGMSLLGFNPAPAYVEKSAIQNRIGYLYDEHVAPSSKPEIEGEKFQAKMSARTAIMVARQNKDSAALNEAYQRGKEAGLSQDYMNKLGREGTDIYLFSRLPQPDQVSILKQATPDERNRYWQKASTKTKQELNQQLRLPQ